MNAGGVSMGVGRRKVKAKAGKDESGFRAS